MQLTAGTFRIDPGPRLQITLSDWAQPSLTADQIRYATLDATLIWHVHCALP